MVANKASFVTAALLAAFALLDPAAARASAPTAIERNLAEQLFIDGKRLMAEGRFDEACPKLAESHRLDPGGGTILNLAMCHIAQGRYASAWAELREAIDIARTDGRPDREEFAQNELAKLEPKLSYLTILVERTAETPGLVVTVDGQSVGPAAWGARFPIDPATHEIVASAPGKKSRRASVKIGPVADHKAVSIAPLEGGAAEPTSSGGTPVAPTTVPAVPSPPAVDARSEPSASGRTLGYVVGGVGVAALGAGSVAGVMALDKRSESDAFCRGELCTTQRGVDLNEDAQRLATYANIGIGAGLVGIAVGAYLLLSSGGSDERAPRAVAPRRLAFAPSFGLNASSLELSGTW